MKDKKYFIWLFIGCLFLFLPLMVMEPQLGHDTSFHLKNIELLAKHFSLNSLSSFFILPETANHLGYGIGIFYPMLPHMIGAFFCNLFGMVSIPTIYSVYFLYFLILYGSSLVVYRLSKKIYKKEILAFFSATLYMMMPYVFGDLFIRMAYNEIFLFFFFPCVVLGLVSLIEGEKKEFCFSFVIGCIGMISSHLVLTLYACLLLLPCLFFYSKSIFCKKNRKAIMLAVGIIVLFVLPNLLLLLTHYLSGNYLVNLDDYITNLELMEYNTLKISEFVLPYKDYGWSVVFYIPIGFWLLFLFSCVLYFKNRKKQKLPYFPFFFCLILVLLFMISKWFPYENVPDLFYMIQFPWRLCTFLILPFSILTPLCFSFLEEEKVQRICIIASFLVLVLLQIPFFLRLMNRPYPLKQYYQKEEVNTAMGHSYEYLPVMSLDHWEERGNEVLLLDGKGNVDIVKNKGTDFVFSISKIQNQVTIELPKLYYYGYEIMDENDQGYRPVMSEDGYVEVTLSKNGTYRLLYVGTKTYQVFATVRLVGGTIFLLFLFYYMRKRKSVV